MEILLILDVQEGFINNITKDIPEKIVKHVNEKAYDLVIATRFINKVESLHQSELNMKDMTMLSKHAKLIGKINEVSDIVLMKSTYTSLTVDVAKLLEKNHVKQVYLTGLNAETSIMATAFDLFDKGIRPVILSELCGSKLGPEMKEASLNILKQAIGSHNII